MTPTEKSEYLEGQRKRRQKIKSQQTEQVDRQQVAEETAHKEKPMKIVSSKKAGSYLSTELAKKLIGANEGEVLVLEFKELPSKEADKTRRVELILAKPEDYPPPEALDREAAVGSG